VALIGGLWLLTSWLSCSNPSVPVQPSFILVSIDTLRADRVGRQIDGLSITPNLDRLAAESHVFHQAYAQSNMTLFSHASVFSGQYPSALHPINLQFNLPEQVPTLASIMGMYGYRTGAIVSGGHLDPVFGLDQGFDHYEVTENWGTLRTAVPAALSWLDASPDRESVLFIHGYDTHERYLKPPPVGGLYFKSAPSKMAKAVLENKAGTSAIVNGVWHPKRRFVQIFNPNQGRPHSTSALSAVSSNTDSAPLTDADLVHISEAYDGATTYADIQVGVLMAELEDRGLLDTSWVIVFSDHGEELGERGLFNHRLGLSDALLHVPLIIRPPGGHDGQRDHTELVALIDILPTVLERAGLPAPAQASGRALMADDAADQPQRTAIFAEGRFRSIGAVDAEGGLSFSGIAAHSPHLLDLLNSTRLDSEAFEAWGTSAPKMLRTAMVNWRAGLHTAQSRVRTDGTNFRARKQALNESGYWGER
jgi:arylsulfatase A-like enzyme